MTFKLSEHQCENCDKMAIHTKFCFGKDKWLCKDCSKIWDAGYNGGVINTTSQVNNGIVNDMATIKKFLIDNGFNKELLEKLPQVKQWSL